MHKMILPQVVLLALTVVHFNRVGVAQWCNINRSEKTIQCNYESKEACESYLGKGEFCQSNPFYTPEKPHISNPYEVPKSDATKFKT
jgi:hypothetical protein